MSEALQRLVDKNGLPNVAAAFGGEQAQAPGQQEQGQEQAPAPETVPAPAAKSTPEISPFNINYTIEGSAQPQTMKYHVSTEGSSEQSGLKPGVESNKDSVASNIADGALRMENFRAYDPNQYSTENEAEHLETSPYTNTPTEYELFDEYENPMGIYAHDEEGNSVRIDGNDETGEILDDTDAKPSQKGKRKGKGKGKGKSTKKGSRSKIKQYPHIDENEQNITDLSHKYGVNNPAVMFGLPARAVHWQTMNRGLYEASVSQREEERAAQQEYVNEHADDIDYDVKGYLKEKFPIRYREDYRYYNGPSVTGEVMDKDEKRLEEQNRYYDLVCNTYTFGMLPAKGAYIVKDPETGEETARWDVGVESRRREISEYLGHDWTSLLATKKIDQLMMLYGAIFPDSHGRWFGKHQGEEGFDSEISLKDQEKILDCILKSLKKYGHPFALPKDVLGHPLVIRGTEVIPAPILPVDMAGFLLDSPNSQVHMKNKDGETVKPTHEVLRAVCFKYLREVVNPYKRDENHCSANQAHIHDQICFALGRLLGWDDEKTAGKAGLKDNDIYGRTVDYYLDSDDNYAAALNGKYGSAEIAEYEKRKLAQWEKISEFKQGKKNRSHRPKTWREYTDSNHTSITRFTQCLRLFIHVQRSVNAGLRAAIAASALVEHAKGTGLATASIGACYRFLGVKKDKISEDVLKKMMSKDGLKAFDAMKMLYAVAGPGGIELFAHSGYGEYNYQNVIAFIRERWSRDLPSEKIAKIEDFIHKCEQKFMAGDYVCRKSDLKNWYKALIFSSANQLKGLQRAERTGKFTGRQLGEAKYADKAQVPLAPVEIDSIIEAAPSFGNALVQLGGTNACISALAMMRAHQIEQTNCMSYSVDQFLKRHNITDAVIATFVDKFPKYGLNFILNNIIPFTKTFNYLATVGARSKGSLVAEDFSIEGANSSFLDGLKVNLVFDLVSIGNPIITGVLLGYVFSVLGFDEPEDDPNLRWNISAWKVCGLEWEENYWANDLLAWNLPVAVFTAALLTDHDAGVAGHLMMDCLYDQLDGNVLLDFAQIVKHYQEDIDIWKGTINTEFDNPPDEWIGYAPVALYGALVRSVKNADPLSVIIEQLANDTLIVGDTAPTRAFWKIYNKDQPWMVEYGLSKDIDDAYEVLLRRNTMYSPLGAFFANLTHRVFTDDKTTGFFFWDMPAKETFNQYQQLLMEKYTIDYSKKPEGMSNEEYKYRKAVQIIDDINSFDGIEEMQRLGYVLPKEARDIAADYLWSYYNWLEAEYSYEKQAGTADWDLYNLRRAEVKDFIYTYLSYDNGIPTSPERYVEILTNKDAYYVDAEGNPVASGAWLQYIDSAIEKKVYNKGDHPSTFMPFTIVDETNANFRKGYNAETSPTYVTDKDHGPTLEDLRKIKIPAGTVYTLADGTEVVMPEGSTLADAPTLSGKFMGQPIGEVMYGGQFNGTFNSPDEQTINQRSWMPKDYYLDPELYNEYDIDPSLVNGGSEGSQALNPNVENPYNMTAKELATRIEGGEGLLAGTGATPNSPLTQLAESSVLAQNGAGSMDELFSGALGQDVDNLAGGNGQPSAGGGTSGGANGAGGTGGTGGGTGTGANASEGGKVGGEAISRLLSSDEPWKNASGSVFGDTGKFQQDIDDYVYNNGPYATKGQVPGYGGSYFNSRSYGYSSGSSSYNPDSGAPVYIYSRSRVLTSDRPFSLGSTKPSSSNATYLRPSVETKGSREAYRRQDF